MERRALQLFVLFLMGIFSPSGYSQEPVKEPLISALEEILVKKEWKIDKILGLDEQVETYTLTLHDRTKYVKFAGNLVHFTNEGTFASEYTAWCGNDNFTWLNGEYRLLGDDRIAINVKEVKYFGEWDKPEEQREMNWVVFSVKHAGDTIIFAKQTDDQIVPVKGMNQTNNIRKCQSHEKKNSSECSKPAKQLPLLYGK